MVDPSDARRNGRTCAPSTFIFNFAEDRYRGIIPRSLFILRRMYIALTARLPVLNIRNPAAIYTLSE